MRDDGLIVDLEAFKRWWYDRMEVENKPVLFGGIRECSGDDLLSRISKCTGETIIPEGKYMLKPHITSRGVCGIDESGKPDMSTFSLRSFGMVPKDENSIAGKLISGETATRYYYDELADTVNIPMYLQNAKKDKLAFEYLEDALKETSHIKGEFVCDRDKPRGMLNTYVAGPHGAGAATITGMKAVRVAMGNYDCFVESLQDKDYSSYIAFNKPIAYIDYLDIRKFISDNDVVYPAQFNNDFKYDRQLLSQEIHKYQLSKLAAQTYYDLLQKPICKITIPETRQYGKSYDRYIYNMKLFEELGLLSSPSVIIDLKPVHKYMCPEPLPPKDIYNVFHIFHEALKDKNPKKHKFKNRK